MEKNFDSQLKDLSDKVGKMYYALMGNELTKDGGLVQRIIDLEIENAKITQKVEELEEEVAEVRLGLSKKELYINILWGVSGVAAASFLGALINYIFNK